VSHISRSLETLREEDLNKESVIQVLKEAQNQTSWLETCARTVGGDVSRGESLSFFRALTSLTSEAY
jgi:hypothetical protein